MLKDKCKDIYTLNKVFILLKTNPNFNTTEIVNGTRPTQPANFCIKIIGTIGNLHYFKYNPQYA